MEQRMTKDQWALFMFISLSQQAEAWSYALKGTVKQRTAMLLNNYIKAANMFIAHIGQYYDLDELHDQAEIWTKLMEYLRGKSPQAQDLLYHGLVDFMEKLENENHEAWTQCKKCLTNYDLREHQQCPTCNEPS